MLSAETDKVNLSGKQSLSTPADYFRWEAEISSEISGYLTIFNLNFKSCSVPIQSWD